MKTPKKPLQPPKKPTVAQVMSPKPKLSGPIQVGGEGMGNCTTKESKK